MSQVAHLSLLLRHGEHLAPGGEDRPFAGRREVVGANQIAHLLPGRPGQYALGRNLHGDLPGLLSSQIQNVQVSAVFIDDRIRAQAGPFDVILLVIRYLTGLSGLCVIAVDVELMLPVRVEVDLILMPHGHVVRSLPVGDLLDFVGLQIVDPYVLRPSPVVAFPGAQFPEISVVGQFTGVRRKGG